MWRNANQQAISSDSCRRTQLGKIFRCTSRYVGSKKRPSAYEKLQSNRCQQNGEVNEGVPWLCPRISLVKLFRDWTNARRLEPPERGYCFLELDRIGWITHRPFLFSPAIRTPQLSRKIRTRSLTGETGQATTIEKRECQGSEKGYPDTPNNPGGLDRHRASDAQQKSCLVLQRM